MEKIKDHGIPESAKDMMKHFGKGAFKLNAHEKKFIQEQGFDTEYLFIETREQRADQRGWCSHCRKWVTLSQYDPFELAHNGKAECPKCGCELTIKHAWRMSKNLYDEALVYLYRPSVINPEVVTARAVSVVRGWCDFLKTPTRMQPEVRVDSFYVYEPGVGGKMLRPTNKMRIYWAESTAITYGGNDQVIENNLIVDCVRESSDAGAIYSGYDWAGFGCRVDRNVLVDIGAGEFTPCGIYFDDAESGQTTVGNLMINVKGLSFLLGGGRSIT